MDTSSNELQGGCHCGTVRYRASGHPYDRTLCHCSICRGTSGAPMVAWFTVKAGDFALLRGSPRTYRSSAVATRSFCAECGTPLTFQRDGLDEVDVTVCSLDDPQALAPQDHTFVRSQLNWIHLADGLPRYAAAREGSGAS
jgi:hypothetical protein